MKKLFCACLLFVGFRSGALGKPDEHLFHARSLEELQTFRDQKIRSPAEVLRGRRELLNGDLEKSTHILANAFGGSPGFYHSVASGDPLPDAVVIWTRYTPAAITDEITLEFRIAAIDPDIPMEDHLDPSANPALKRGKVNVTSTTDFIAKIDVTGLPSNTAFVYVFSDSNQTSDIGMTRTAPAQGDEEEELVYAFFSCSHFSNGYFHAYDIASTIEGIDIALFLGDYYYEYGSYHSYAKEAAQERDAFVLPLWETIDLQDYRNRHATYVAHDEGLRNLRRRVPIMAFWDDHETTNDSYCNTVEGCGAENHQDTCPVNATAPDEAKDDAQCDRDEGDALQRFTEAAQAFWEWMPIRHQEGSMGPITTGSFTKVIEWGDLATFVGFDTRTSYRTQKSTGDNGAY